MTVFGAASPPRKCTFAEKITENPLTFFSASCIMSKLRNGSIAQPGEHLPYKQGVTGSSPVVPTSFSIAYASVAQLVEQGTENPRVVGSIPTEGTTCGFSSSGRARPCQGRGSEFKPRNPLQIYAPNTYVWGVNSIWRHSQEVRQRSAKPRFTSPNLVVASRKSRMLCIRDFSLCANGSTKRKIAAILKKN